MADNPNTLKIILAELERLAAIAERDGFLMLAYLIEAAATEARDQLKRLAS